MLIILDRDGVINVDSSNYIKSPDEWQALPNSLEAIAQLNHHQHTVVVATNQSGVGRGYYSEQTLDAIHQKMRDALAKFGGHVDGIYYCPHTPNDGCDCRKPKPGLLRRIANDYPQYKFSSAVFVGDSLRDIDAARQAGCQAALVKTGNGENTLANHSNKLIDVAVYADLMAFVQQLLTDQ